jgi:hypothetical protein
VIPPTRFQWHWLPLGIAGVGVLLLLLQLDAEVRRSWGGEGIAAACVFLAVGIGSLLWTNRRGRQ